MAALEQFLEDRLASEQSEDLGRNSDPAADVGTIPDSEQHGKLDNLKPRDCIVGDPEELVHMDWYGEPEL